MLGLRGVRLGLVVPGLYAMQVRAIVEAAARGPSRAARRWSEIMVPLVGSVMELHLDPRRDRRDHRRIADGAGVVLTIPIGTMIELPRAALTARRIAEVAEFFSFGTNDLTQTTWGFSRDDVEASILRRLPGEGRVHGVAVRVAGPRRCRRAGADGRGERRSTRPDLKLGICGEHGGDPESMHFFHDVGLDYVSCSPYRVPVARLEAGRAALASETGGEGL